MGNWAFGCDVCQDVCPWNRFAKQHEEPLLKPKSEFLDLTRDDWEELTEVTFDTVFKNSAVKRTRYEGLMRNLSFINY